MKGAGGLAPIERGRVSYSRDMKGSLPRKRIILENSSLELWRQISSLKEEIQVKVYEANLKGAVNLKKVDGLFVGVIFFP